MPVALDALRLVQEVSAIAEPFRGVRLAITSEQAFSGRARRAAVQGRLQKSSECARESPTAREQQARRYPMQQDHVGAERSCALGRRAALLAG